MKNEELFNKVVILYRRGVVSFDNLILSAEYLFYPHAIGMSSLWMKYLGKDPRVNNKIVSLITELKRETVL